MHEYCHGISNRLTGGPDDVGCLGFGESGGMGEGWGDIFATITRTNASTTREQNYGMGDYSNGGEGIRNYLVTISGFKRKSILYIHISHDDL
jgi:extracellular elastinolytic metalloproteinase